MKLNVLRLFAVVLCLCFAPLPVRAQAVQAYDDAHMDQIMAPIALYPDSLLGEVLMASTYPVQIVEASRWLDDTANADLQGEAVATALEQKDWDASIKALIAFPELLQEMNDQIEWTQQLGQAFTMQQADMLNSVQRLRNAAYQAGNLQSNGIENVIMQNGNISVEASDPAKIPLPSYGPSVYGAWPYPDSQPYSFVTPSFYSVSPPPVPVSILPVQAFWGGAVYDWRMRRVEWNRPHNRPVVGGHAVIGREEEVSDHISEQAREPENSNTAAPQVLPAPQKSHLPPSQTAPLLRGHEAATQDANQPGGPLGNAGTATSPAGTDPQPLGLRHN